MRRTATILGALLLAACGTTDQPRTPDDRPTDGGTCIPLSCESQGAECGALADGCGGTLQCGECAGGDVCGADNVCTSPACTPRTCEQAGAECGTIDDGCGGTASCGGCPEGQTCGGGGANICGEASCTPQTCADAGATCGRVSDGCGDLLQCGSCGDGETCEENACVTTCEPRTCEEAGAQCGSVSDGCGGTLDCGGCPSGHSCGGAGTANQCGAGDDPCEGLRPGTPGQPTGSFQTPETVSYGSTVCGAGTTDGTGHIALRRANHSVSYYVLSPDGTLLNEPGGYTYLVQPQLRGFIGLENTGLEGYRIEVLSPSGQVQSQKDVSATGSATMVRDPRGGVVLLHRPQDLSAPERLEAFDEDGNSRWRVELPFTMVSNLAVDRLGNTLVLTTRSSFGDGTLAGVWVDGGGDVGEVFKAAEGLPSGGSYVLYPRVGSGLFLLRDSTTGTTWVRSFDSLASTGQPAPSWLMARRDTTLHMARGGQAYAFLPIARRGVSCEQTIEVVAPTGESCGTATFGFGTGTCDTRELTVGYDGTVIQRVPQKHEECVTPGHCKCEWRWWSELLE